jgi:hypothetical protein
MEPGALKRKALKAVLQFAENVATLAVGIVIAALIILGLSMLTSCSTVKYVPVETVRVETETVERVVRDSILKFDSIYIHERADTVWVERYSLQYRDRWKTDSIKIVDSVAVEVPYPVEVEKRVNYVNGWQNFQMWLGRILLIALLGWGAWWLIRKKLII